MKAELSRDAVPVRVTHDLPGSLSLVLDLSILPL